MLLSIRERLMLMQVLPTEGDFTTLKLVREMREGLSFDEEEHAKAHFVVDGEGGRITWDPEIQFDKELDFGPRATVVVLDALEKLDRAGQLRLEALELCDKFGYEGYDETRR